ncbi:UDP-Gal or UDP-GlcNAc-dependent glycosyltransferase, partial [Trypanosoma grayi]|uniref:UDP-Gal or UDP-GlcNAc-dependent glycosyltransferase n=1 Tax=Trypanosoma grayi TaxID=71804 RepID=UPI0004F490CC
MARKRLRPISTNVLCIVAFLGSAVGLYCLLLGTLTQSAELFTDDSPASVSLVGQCSGEGDAGSECLQYIPRSVVRTWKNRDFLILFGIPSVDIRGRRRLRTLQRSTCWQFPHVATKSNNFTGAMLVLYVLARHPSHNFTYSLALQREAAEWHDVIALPMNEGRSSTNKKIGGGGFWGNEAEVGMSRKTFFWFELALCLFPNVSYIAKGDDDMFLRVPQYLADLRSLPRRGVYWGSTAFINSVASFQMVVGFCMTLSRDVVQQFVSYKP